MKKSFKYSLLIMLTLLIITSLVNAQPVPIGTTEQTRPYESNPTVATATNIATAFGAERDGSLTTGVAFQGIAAAPVGFVIFDGFTAPPTTFNIGWVDIKIKYKHTQQVAPQDDGYSIAYNTDGSAIFALWLQMAVSGSASDFDKNGNPQVRPWSNLARSGGGAWTWADVSNFRVRIMVIRGANAAWDVNFDLFEVWLTIYEAPPPAASTAMSVMPPSDPLTSQYGIMGLQPGKFFFVDVYVNGLTSPPGLWGYQATIKYDESIVTATQWFSYWPFITHAASGVTPGVVSVSYGTFAGDKVGFTGTATPLARIYFQVDAGGETPLDLIDDRSLVPPLISELKPVGVPGYVPPLYDSWFSSPHYLSAHTSAPTLINLANPINTKWHELYPQYSKEWVLTSWEDVSPDNPGVLGHSDQIDMANASGWKYWFHVDQVTITIHWTFKDEFGAEIPGEVGAAEPEDPMLEMPGGSPIGSLWHMIYPVYSRTIEITSWEDSDLNGYFNPSDQFDFTYLPFDVLLAGSAPPAGAPLSIPGPTILYDDADGSGTWSVGEGVWDDLDYDYMYTPAYAFLGLDVLLVGTEPDYYDFGSPPGPTNKYYDADGSGTWDVGEPAIDDLDLSGTYDPQVTEWAHLDGVSTDILVSQKPIPPEPPELEFPLGLGLVIAIAPLIPLIYLWRRKRWEK